MALRAVSAVAKALPGFAILGIGGVDSADSALQFLHCGASVVQVCSAVQNQDFTVIEDYCTGLRALLYLRANPPPTLESDAGPWDGQSPPRTKVQRGKPIAPLTDENGKPILHFGPYAKKREEILAQQRLKNGVSTTPAQVIPRREKSVIAPSVASMIGLALERIGPYKKLDNSRQVVALIDDDLCINCGKCYMACNDSGYQAIEFGAEDHRPVVTDDCTGCTLCLSVCPVIDCISMVPKKIPHVIKRGQPTTLNIHPLS
uniref:dihydropyrimidine dehydrogenase (NADP(+)) n=1 Tax=Xenopsylla cheopis TaxID=163159 RepID=A0A6M2E2Y3_XENCH